VGTVERVEVAIAREWYFKYIPKATDTDATVQDMMLAMGVCTKAIYREDQQHQSDPRVAQGFPSTTYL
jgi:hypothetical protein